MNFFNRAIKNVTRKVSKTILLALTFFVIGNFVIVGLSVSTATESAKTLTRQKMRAVVTHEIDYNAFYTAAEQIEDEDERNEFYKNYPYISLKDVDNILKDSRIKTANCSQNTTLYAGDDSIDFVHLNNQVESDMNQNTEDYCYFDSNGEEMCYSNRQPIFFAKGNFFPNLIELVDGDFNIIEGSFYTQDDLDENREVCLISETLAKTNNLTVGDTLSVMTSNLDSYYKKMGLTEEDITKNLKIIGIYTHNKQITPDSSGYDYTYPYENFDNLLLIPGTTMYKWSIEMSQLFFDYYSSQWPEDEYYSDPSNRPTYESKEKIKLNDVTFLLNDPLDVDDFVKEYSSNVGDYKKLNPNNEEFIKLSKPLDTLNDYAKFIIYLVVTNAIVIITLVTALTLKTREYEIGVLLSIGASKFKVIMQFFIELAIVAIIGFTLSVGSGSLISKKVGTTLLENQIESSGVTNEDEVDYWYGTYESIWDNSYTTEISMEDIISEYNVTVSPIIIGEIYVLGLGIVLISVLIPSAMIMRFNPKKILMNQQ